MNSVLTAALSCIWNYDRASSRVCLSRSGRPYPASAAGAAPPTQSQGDIGITRQLRVAPAPASKGLGFIKRCAHRGPCLAALLQGGVRREILGTTLPRDRAIDERIGPIGHGTPKRAMRRLCRSARAQEPGGRKASADPVDGLVVRRNRRCRLLMTAPGVGPEPEGVTWRATPECARQSATWLP